ncbi:hypothetical protein FF1_018736 [Malus domestica]|uniref:uncharacterized protein n=1 Tax=Malus domestica TaxID=3750 RepID=UPI00397681DB
MAACLDMYNPSEHKFAPPLPPPPMSPRISFSNDFADAIHHEIRREVAAAPPAVSSDFEFSVSNYSMMSADELFFKGRLLPFKDGCSSQTRRSTTTLRDELLHGEDHDDDVSSSRPPKGSSSTRWKGLLGRKSRSHIVSKKAEKSDGDGRRSELAVVHEEAQHQVNNNISQEVLSEGGSSWRDVEIGI